MCYIDLEPCSVWRETRRKARKLHRCSCCCREIQPGETYVVHFSIFEGNKLTNKCCIECDNDRTAFASAHEGNLPAPDYFPYVLSECISEDDGEDDGEDGIDWRPMLARIEASRKVYREAKQAAADAAAEKTNESM